MLKIRVNAYGKIIDSGEKLDDFIKSQKAKGINWKVISDNPTQQTASCQSPDRIVTLIKD